MAGRSHAAFPLSRRELERVSEELSASKPLAQALWADSKPSSARRTAFGGPTVNVAEDPQKALSDYPPPAEPVARLTSVLSRRHPHLKSLRVNKQVSAEPSSSSPVPLAPARTAQASTPPIAAGPDAPTLLLQQLLGRLRSRSRVLAEATHAPAAAQAIAAASTSTAVEDKRRRKRPAPSSTPAPLTTPPLVQITARDAAAIADRGGRRTSAPFASVGYGRGTLRFTSWGQRVV